jgi:hypothetical protein
VTAGKTANFYKAIAAGPRHWLKLSGEYEKYQPLFVFMAVSSNSLGDHFFKVYNEGATPFTATNLRKHKDCDDIQAEW